MEWGDWIGNCTDAEMGCEWEQRGDVGYFEELDIREGGFKQLLSPFFLVLMN